MSRLWGFFNGAFEGYIGKCEVECIPFLSHRYSFSFSCGLGFGSNNMVEVKAILFRMDISIGKYIHDLYFFW